MITIIISLVFGHESDIDCGWSFQARTQWRGNSASGYWPAISAFRQIRTVKRIQTKYTLICKLLPHESSISDGKILENYYLRLLKLKWISN